MRYYLLKTLRLSYFCATFWLNSVKIRKKYSKIFGTFAEMRYFCNRNQEQVQDFKRNDGTFRTSRLTTSIKVQISRESQRDRTLQTSKENATQLARL